MFTYMKLHVMKAVHINDSSNSVFLVKSGIVNMWKSSLLGISLAFYLISMSLSKSVERKLMNISKVYCASYHYILISCAYFVKPLHAGFCVLHDQLYFQHILLFVWLLHEMPVQSVQRCFCCIFKKMISINNINTIKLLSTNVIRRSV